MSKKLHWYAYCASCDWTGTPRKNPAQAEAERDSHVCKHVVWDIAPHAFRPAVIEDEFEEIP